VVAGAAGDDLHRTHVVEDRRRFGTERLLEQASAADSSLEGVGQRARLLVDLLDHVVAVVATLDGIGSQLAGADLALDDAAGRVVDGHAIPAQIGDVALLEEHEALGHRQQRHHVRSDEVLADTQADHQRAAATGRHQPAGFVDRDHAQGVGALQLGDRGLDRSEQVEAGGQVVVDPVHHHLGVGVGVELVIVLGGPERLEVLDDAVVNQPDPFTAEVRVGIRLTGWSMGRPARVCDAGAPGERRLGQRRLETRHLPGHAGALQAAGLAAQHRHAGRVVAAVLEPMQALDQDRDHVALGHRPDDAAHAVSLPWCRGVPGSQPARRE
jgi:hypothetical protein